MTDATATRTERPNLFDLHARERLGVGDDWSVYHFESEQRRPDLPKVYILRGAVAPFKTRGKYKHHRDWGKMDPATDREVVITFAEHDAWVKAWVLRTGNCPRCVGVGDTPVSSSAAGTVYAPCRECAGTGKVKGGAK